MARAAKGVRPGDSYLLQSTQHNKYIVGLSNKKGGVDARETMVELAQLIRDGVVQTPNEAKTWVSERIVRA